MNCPACAAPNSDDAVACAECGIPTLTLPAMGPGFVLAARYEILKILGRGGMGMVYQAHDRMLEETVAIKVLRPDAAASHEIQQRFRAEIKMARAVSHKNVCRIHEYGEDRGIRYISMAYVDGVDLKQVLRQQGPLPPADAFEAMIRVADALQAIHDEGIIHRDLKTPNIMLDGKGVVRLMDFGIAKQKQGDGLSMTVTGQIIGTPEYMSPEQVQAHRLDNRSDVYSLGVVVFEVFTGATPFRADTPLGTVLKHLNEPPPLEGSEATLLPAAVVPVLRKALAKRKEDRYASAREMAQALEAARAATPLATHRLHATPTESAVPRAGETLLPTLEQPKTVPRPAAADATTLLPTRRAARGPLASRWVAAGLAGAALLAVAAAWILLQPPPPANVASSETPPPASPQPSPPLTSAPAAAPTPAAASTLAATPATPSPRASASTPDRARAASEVRAAQASFNQGRYDEALLHAEAALRLDSSEAAARTLAQGAAAGQLADRRLTAAEAALRNGDLDQAQKDVDAAAQAAPWDGRATPLRARIQEARATRARPGLDPRVERLLAEGDAALEAQSFDVAIARYDEALRLDSRNGIARMGRATAVSAKAARAGATRAPAKAGFVSERTLAESVETRPDDALASGFESSPDIKVTRDTQPAQLPGRIEFKTEPASVGPGEKYKLEVRFVNTGTAAIEIKDMLVTTTVNDRNASGPVAPAVSTVAPGQSAAVLTLADTLREDLRSWSLEVVLRTRRGEGYRNRLVWSPAGAPDPGR